MTERDHSCATHESSAAVDGYLGARIKTDT
jgi:hypothetical protein